tara:strand:+ start:91 stop:315 length:225 start_codon:yes stop_codon:yes gene_type:complete
MKPIIKVEDLVYAAENSFFIEVTKRFPKANTGDTDPYVTVQWSKWNEWMIIDWWRFNASDFYHLKLDNGKILKE